MAFPVSHRLLALSTVKAALLSITGGTEYVNDLSVVGLQTKLLTSEQVTPDKSPHVVVYVGDSEWTDVDANLGERKERLDVVIGAILRPDFIRSGASFDLYQMAEEWAADVLKTIELNAYALVEANGNACAKVDAIRVSANPDDYGAFALVEIVVTYVAYGVLGS